MSVLTHIDADGKAQMVDISAKQMTLRSACAQALVSMSSETLQLIISGKHKKGDVFAVARIAGIQAAKKCADLIPLCHPLMLTSIDIELQAEPEHKQVRILSRCKLNGRTGVEMEALMAASTAALTIYDMCKAVDRSMIIEVKLLAKEGGSRGDWQISDDK